MKRLFPLLVSLILIVTLVMSVSAASPFPSIDGLYDPSVYPYFLFCQVPDGVFAFVSTSPLYLSDEDSIFPLHAQVGIAGFSVFVDGSWAPFTYAEVSEDSYPDFNFAVARDTVMYSNYDLLLSDDSLFHKADVLNSSMSTSTLVSDLGAVSGSFLSVCNGIGNLIVHHPLLMFTVGIFFVGACIMFFYRISSKR